MKISQLPSGSYTTQIQIGGIRKRITAKTKKEVHRRALEYSVTRSVAPCKPLGALIDNYINNKSNVLSPSTIERYRRIRKHYFQQLMNVTVDTITQERMQKEINRMAATYSPKTVRNAYGLITATLDMFAPGIKFRVTMPAKQKTEYHIPTTEDVYQLLSIASDNMRTAIMLAAFCGLRRGEIVALDASDISNNVLHVSKSAVYNSNYQVIIKRPKTYHSDRYITMPDIVKNHIAEKTGRICPLSLSTITREFDRIRDSIGLQCRFHDLRHYYASVLHAIGIPDQYIMQAGGWKSDFMLKAVYRNTLDDFKAQNDAKINAFFNKSGHEMHTNSPQTP